MNYRDFQQNNEELKNHLYCVGTVYDSFEALIEVLGRLKLEQPLYMVYLAQKLFAQEVIIADSQIQCSEKMPYNQINVEHIHRSVN